MDVKDHKGGICGDIYGLIKSAQQLRMPDVGSLVIKQDEGEEVAGALPEWRYLSEDIWEEVVKSIKKLFVL